MSVAAADAGRASSAKRRMDALVVARVSRPVCHRPSPGSPPPSAPRVCHVIRDKRPPAACGWTCLPSSAAPSPPRSAPAGISNAAATHTAYRDRNGIVSRKPLPPAARKRCLASNQPPTLVPDVIYFAPCGGASPVLMTRNSPLAMRSIISFAFASPGLSREYSRNCSSAPSLSPCVSSAKPSA